jgi:hypothetical protein
MHHPIYCIILGEYISIKRLKILTIISGLLVAATTVTLTKASTPSNSFNNWDNTRSATEVPPSAEPLLTVNASISS